MFDMSHGFYDDSSSRSVYKLEIIIVVMMKKLLYYEIITYITFSFINLKYTDWIDYKIMDFYW